MIMCNHKYSFYARIGTLVDEITQSHKIERYVELQVNNSISGSLFFGANNPLDMRCG